MVGEWPPLLAPLGVKAAKALSEGPSLAPLACGHGMWPWVFEVELRAFWLNEAWLHTDYVPKQKLVWFFPQSRPLPDHQGYLKPSWVTLRFGTGLPGRCGPISVSLDH